MITRISKALACGLGAVLFSFIPLTSHAQAIYGSIYGTVTDNTGAIIPNAAVTVTDEAKGTSFDVVTNASGEYSVQHLIPDVYDVKVVVSGFQTAETKGIQVFADSSPKADIQMTVGGATQTVEVSADAVPLLKTDRADVATEFTSQDISSVPLPNRNFTAIQLLLPGAQQLNWAHAADENPQASLQIQVDGQAFGGVAYQLDGTDNQDPILGIIVINPPLDAMAETKITTQNFDAEFGKAVSSVIVANTKSGSNSFHGSVFDYRESNANLARDPYTQSPVSGNNTGGLIPGGLKNQFGGSVGGPILKDRLFFFADYQGVRQKVGTSASATVPSPLLVSSCLSGTGCDFSDYSAFYGATTPNFIYHTVNGQQVAYPNNVIPASDVSPEGLAFIKYFQNYAPNKAGAYGLAVGPDNYAASGTGIFNNNQWDERVDWQASQKMHVFERFSRFTDTLSGTNLFGPAGGPGFGINGYGGDSEGANDSLAAGADIAINATLLTDFRVGYYRYNIADALYNAGTPFASNLGWNGLNLGTAQTSGAPEIQVADVGVQGNGAFSGSTGAVYGGGLNINRCNCPLIEREDQYQIVNNWTKIIGNHSIKFGADLRYARNLRVPSDNSRVGIVNFNPGPTSNGTGAAGLGWATLMLGDVSTFSRYVSTSTNAKEFQKRLFFYGQDTWHPNPKLTVNVGLRYELYFPEVVNANGNGSLMQMNSPSTTDGYYRVAGIGSFGTNMGWSPPSNAWNPRVGVAYQIDPKTVIRSGYGRSFDLGVFGSIFGHVVTQNIPVLATQSITNSTNTSASFTLANGPAAFQFPAVPSNGLLPSPGYLASPKARPNGLRLPTLDAWNLSIQRSLTPTLSVTLAYVANKGTHTLSDGDGNNTNPNEAGIFLPANYSIEGRTLHFDPNPTNPDANGVGADGGTKNNLFLQRYYGGTTAACQNSSYIAQILAYQAANPAFFPSTIQPGQCGWTSGIGYYGDDQDSHFNALQATIAKQFTKGLSFTVNYAWQDSIDWASGYATWSKPAVKGRDSNQRRNQIVGYGVWQLPFGKKGMYASNVPTWADMIIGGWQFSPTFNWATGLPFTIGYANCGALSGPGPCYPNGSGSYLKTSLSSLNPVAHTRRFFNPTSTPLYNPTTGVYTTYAGFSATALDQIGSAGRNDAYGPHVFNADLALQKSIPIHESVTGQFRMDAFNGFNHMNAGNPSTNIDAGGGVITGGPFVNGTNPRQLQFSFRIDF